MCLGVPPDCTGAPDCSDLGRGPCSLDTPEQTCASCLPGHVGEQGDGNTQCICMKLSHHFMQLQKKIYSLVFLFPSPLSSFHLPSPLPLSPLLFPSPLSSIFSSHLPAVCSGAPDCTALNRYPCSEVPNTCGRCFSRHLGVEGFSNESCFGMSLYNQTRAPSSINQSSFSLSQIESAQTPFRNIDFSERG